MTTTNRAPKRGRPKSTVKPKLICLRLPPPIHADFWATAELLGLSGPRLIEVLLRYAHSKPRRGHTLPDAVETAKAVGQVPAKTARHERAVAG